MERILAASIALFFLAWAKQTKASSWFSTRKEYDSERIHRMEFVKAMKEAEESNIEAKHRKSLTDRLLALAERVSPSRRLENNNEDQYFKYEDVNDWNDVENLANMAIKYVGCEQIQRWDDNLAASGATPLVLDRFAMFRLCDADSCSSYNKWGCNANYGEYAIPMEDYLSLMAEYHFQQYSRYCKTCFLCSKLDYYNREEYDYQQQQNANNATQNNGDDDTWSGYRQYWYEPDYWDDDQGYNRRRMGNNNQGGGAANYYYGDYGNNVSYNDYNQNQNKWYADENTGKCLFEDVCSNFRGACKGYNPNETFYESYFSCSKFTVGNSVGYLAPHCGSDGHTIGIAMYGDAYCTDYIGDHSNVQEFTGQKFDDADLSNYYDKNCISCLADDGFSLITDDAITSNEDLTYPLCSVLYENSAKCNKHADGIISYNEDEANQETNEGNVCQFLEVLNEHSYNERGTIYIASNKIGEWMHDPRASVAQKMLLVISGFTFAFLSVYAVYLTKKLLYRKPWRPPRNVHSPYSSGAFVSGYAASEAGRISRASSGIVALRSEEGSYIRDPWENDKFSRNRGTFA